MVFGLILCVEIWFLGERRFSGIDRWKRMVEDWSIFKVILRGFFWFFGGGKEGFLSRRLRKDGKLSVEKDISCQLLVMKF